jgi:cellulase/cellobiase CelA1
MSKGKLSAICVAGLTLATLLGTAVPATSASPPTRAAQATIEPADPYCVASVMVVSQWSTGYAAMFTVRNISTVTVRWRLVVTLYGPVWGFSVWNATATQNGSTIAIVPAPAGGILAPGQTAYVGEIFAPQVPGAQPPQVVVTCTPV